MRTARRWSWAAGVTLLALGCGEPAPGPGSHDAAVAFDAACPACPPTADFAAGLADPLAPARWRPGTAFLRSSREVEPAAGMRNVDHSHFVRVEGGRAVLAEETGPGVITRLWFTFGPDSTVGDRTRLHLTIDGREIEFVAGEVGVPLARLTSGELPGLPHPWVLGRALASGGFLVSVPIHYASSVRIEIDEPAAGSWTYYQVDGRTLPREVAVTPFDVGADAARDAALARATELWVGHDHEGNDLVDAPRALAPGDAIERALIGPGVITTIDVGSLREQRDELELSIEVDGVEVARAPLGWLTGSAPPGGPYDSALSAASEASAALYAPIPFDVSARVVVRSTAAGEVSAGLRVRSRAGPVDADVGRFEARCSSQTIDIPESICEQASAEQHANVIVGGALTGRGQCAGQTFVMRSPASEEWWWALECDHEVWVDGDYALLGTGTEDYFGGAFYFMNGPFSSPTTGASGWVRDVAPSSDTHMFRWHLVDGIPYERELRFEYESYVDGTVWDGCVIGYRFE
ncbi:MAG: DUF2961 domain-containing protein [Myxococcota bacterium]|nr:DUF2961 domain-containing protein [Myxococcota bacterium]